VPSTGQLQSVTLGAVTTGFTYNGYGEVSAIAATWPGGAYSESLVFDDAGRLVGVDEGATHFVYGYDAVGRLVSSHRDGAPQGNWSYSGNGNRVVNGTEAATYDAQDRLVTAGAAVFVFDALGGRQTKTVGRQVARYAHDGVGALQAVTLPDGTVISYDYDGLQRRIAKRCNGVVEKRWVYDGQYRVIAEVDASGTVTSRFVYGSLGHSPDYLQRGRATYAYIHNHLGSVKYVVDVSSGAVAQRLDYDEWGQVVADSSPGFQPFGFAGGVYDVDTALTHFGYRDYDARFGVWTSKDPIRLAGGLGEYAYVQSSPLRCLDPTGRDTIVNIWTGESSHASVFVDNGVGGRPTLFDPGGSYGRSWWHVGPGAEDSYRNYWARHGDPVQQVFKFATTAEEEAAITQEFQTWRNDPGPMMCAIASSNALTASGHFGDVGSLTPGGLGRELSSYQFWNVTVPQALTDIFYWVSPLPRGPLWSSP
jgi:RHS repeat-associated protein